MAETLEKPGTCQTTEQCPSLAQRPVPTEHLAGSSAAQTTCQVRMVSQEHSSWPRLGGEPQPSERTGLQQTEHPQGLSCLVQVWCQRPCSATGLAVASFSIPCLKCPLPSWCTCGIPRETQSWMLKSSGSINCRPSRGRGRQTWSRNAARAAAQPGPGGQPPATEGSLEQVPKVSRKGLGCLTSSTYGHENFPLL
ncbi:uncharacterized protein LOC128793409 isoform X6 [Vidua chalybeata]|uniref:uncharacterized protein LOC128793409 isoform X6 n=1 Tax=Vidua chalybeata TaxID=81927 RepID=UPI0023A8386F|nr:uncharacterized protein LOC128793409 isoform X6 [Vidua chalybeata]